MDSNDFTKLMCIILIVVFVIIGYKYYHRDGSYEITDITTNQKYYVNSYNTTPRSDSIKFKHNGYTVTLSSYSIRKLED